VLKPVSEPTLLIINLLVDFATFSTFEKRLKYQLYLWVIYNRNFLVGLSTLFQLLKNISNINTNHLRVFLNAFGVFLNDF
jgi:hypothetical protein